MCFLKYRNFIHFPCVVPMITISMDQIFFLLTVNGQNIDGISFFKEQNADVIYHSHQSI